MKLSTAVDGGWIVKITISSGISAGDVLFCYTGFIGTIGGSDEYSDFCGIQIEEGGSRTAFQRNDSRFGGVATGKSTDIVWTRGGGVQQYLEGTSFMYAANGATLIGMVKAPAQSDRRVYAEASGSSNNPIYAFGTGSADTSAVRCFIRNDTGTTILSAEFSDTVFDDTWRVLIIEDDGSGIRLYNNNVPDSAGTLAYTRSGSLTMDNSALFALPQATVASHLNGQIGNFVLIDRILTDAERELATGAMASYAGLSSLTGLLGGRAVCNFPRITTLGDFAASDWSSSDFFTG